MRPKSLTGHGSQPYLERLDTFNLLFTAANVVVHHLGGIAVVSGEDKHGRGDATHLHFGVLVPAAKT
jgi:hypothetical protein